MNINRPFVRKPLPRTPIDSKLLLERFRGVRENKTVPEVFIIESLSFDDEANFRHEGKILADVLRMCGKKPAYYYFRTAAELNALAELFKKSKSRYLHVSCHGDALSIETTLDKIPLIDFASIFADKLNKRRLFVSACSVGSALSADIVRGRNSELLSLAAPENRIPFTHAVALWTAFYVKMKYDHVDITLRHSCKLFGTRFSWSCKTKGEWSTKSLIEDDSL